MGNKKRSNKTGKKAIMQGMKGIQTEAKIVGIEKYEGVRITKTCSCLGR